MESLPKISVCMIVKNEERHLHKCLSSVANFADEIVVVDTGSTDNTIKIAQSFGAIIHREEWKNDFSYHRNKSIGYATGDWIVQIDADETMEFLNSDPKDFKERLSTMPKDCHVIGVKIQDVGERGQIVLRFIAPRIFRNNDKVHFERPVHNELIYEGDVIFAPQIFLWHFGYSKLTKEEITKKKARLLGQLEKAIKDDPNDHKSIFYLAMAYGKYGILDKAIAMGKTYLSYKNQLGEAFQANIYAALVQNYVHLGKLDSAIVYLKMGLENDPSNLDLNYLLLQIGLETGNRGDIQMGCAGYLKAYANFEMEFTLQKSRFCVSYSPEIYAFCYYHLAISKFEDGLELTQNLFSFMHNLQEGFKNNLQKELGTNFIELQKKMNMFFRDPKKLKKENAILLMGDEKWQ